MQDSNAIAVVIISSLFLIVLIGLVLFLFVQKSPGMALCLIGVFLSIAAAVHASVSGLPVNHNQNAGQMFVTATGSGPLLKIAVILVLSGVGIIFLSRPGSAPKWTA